MTTSEDNPLCADCGRPPKPPIECDENLVLCRFCYLARLIEVEKANAVSAAQECIRWHHVRLDGHAVPPLFSGGRRA